VKILFINPDFEGPYRASSIFMPPIGMLYVATVVRDTGRHEVRLVDEAVDGLVSESDLEEADLVAVTCLSAQFQRALGIVRQARQLGKIVVMGGPHPTFQTREILSKGCVDYIVRGEGEQVFSELAASLEESGGKADPSKILGLSWRDGQGNVQDNPPRAILEDIDTLPIPDRELLNIEAYKATKLEKVHTATTLVTSRGCPYNCSFCISTRMTGRRWRPRSVDSIVQEIELLRDRYGFQGIFFVDDNLSASIPRLERLCRAMIERRVGMRWWAMSRADTVVKNEKLMALMARSGCGTIFMGLESSSDAVLDSYGKESSVAIGAQAVRILHKHGIRSQTSFILGSPDEKVRDMRRTIDYAKRLNPKVGQFSLLTPFPGAALWDELQGRILTKDWSLYDCTHAVYRSDNASAATRERMWKRAYREFYIRPRYVLEHWKTINFKKTFALLSKMKTKKKAQWNGEVSA